MNALDEARQLQRSPITHYDEPTLRRIVDGLVQLIINERKEHAREIHELDGDARDGVSAAISHARHSMNEFGGRDT